MRYLTEPARETPVAHECDLCIVGGSCTGVFAAVRAARLGLRVALIEVNMIFGGMAAAAQVNEWHTLLDAAQETAVIGGLTVEVLERLRRRGALRETPGGQKRYCFNSAELAAELDILVRESAIRPFLGARCVAAFCDAGRVRAVIMEDKSGRRAVSASVFVDASGDGDLLHQAGFAWRKPDSLQPVTYQALVDGFAEFSWPAVRHHIAAYDYPAANAAPWLFPYPVADAGVGGRLRNVFGPRLQGIDGTDADQVTETLMEGRRLHRALTEMARRELSLSAAVVAWPHALGVRETRHAECLYTLSGSDLLNGTHFPDAIANGTYPVDIHSPEGTLLRFLDGAEEVIAPDGSRRRRRWRESDAPSTPCYHIPYRSLVPRGAVNLLVAGRILDADREAFGGVRVMVNMNQTGEAAGVAAALAMQSAGRGNPDVSAVCPHALRTALAAGGSLIR